MGHVQVADFLRDNEMINALLTPLLLAILGEPDEIDLAPDPFDGARECVSKVCPVTIHTIFSIQTSL